MNRDSNPSKHDRTALSGLKIEDLKIGSGRVAKRGDRVTMRYSGHLSRGDAFQKDITATTTLGERRVIAGLERGLEGMRAGGIRRLRISPHLGYRDKGVAGVVPPNAVLFFEVELLSIAE
jgi:FKBP-type peptidyl-prolyl cis-trans isomerase FkpA